MTAMIFDTHNVVNRLTAQGMPLRHEVLADEQACLIYIGLTTEDDMDRLRPALRADQVDNRVCRSRLSVTHS